MDRLSALARKLTVQKNNNNNSSSGSNTTSPLFDQSSLDWPYLQSPQGSVVLISADVTFGGERVLACCGAV
jgi:hypothetical protein